MSEQKLSYFEQLDAWTNSTIVMPLTDPAHEDNFDAVVEQVKKAIRQKVLESYRNGQAAGPKAARPGRKATSYAPKQTR